MKVFQNKLKQAKEQPGEELAKLRMQLSALGRKLVAISRDKNSDTTFDHLIKQFDKTQARISALEKNMT